MSLNPEQFFHASPLPPEKWAAENRPDYIHVGTREAAERRSRGKMPIYEVSVQPQRPLNSREHPLEDWDANLVGMVDSHHASTGKMPRVRDLDPDFADAPQVARGLGWKPHHDVVYYENDVERRSGRPSVSAMVRRSSISTIRRLT